MRYIIAPRWPWTSARCAILLWGCQFLYVASAGTSQSSDSTPVTSTASSTLYYPYGPSLWIPPPPPAECTAPSTDDLQYDYGAFNISSQADIDALSGCATVYGDVVIRSEILESITISGIELIRGNLEVSNCSKLTNISAPILNGTDEYNFTLSNLPLLTALDFPAWSESCGTLSWQALPALTQVNVGQPFYPIDSLILINTGLNATSVFTFTDLNGYSSGTYGEVRIKNNPNLSDIVLDSLQDSNSLEISNNGPSAKALLDSLETGGNISISDVASLLIPRLQSVGGNLDISNNTFNTFEAVNISNIRGDFMFRDNNIVTTLKLSSLRYIGDYEYAKSLVVANNTALKNIDFPSLESVYRNITLTGNLSSVSMPLLADLNFEGRFHGSFFFQSTAPGLDCSYFDHMNYWTVHGKQSWYYDDIPSSYAYLCQSIPPGATKDRAKHWKSPYRFPKGGKIAIIVIMSIIGAFLLVITLRWCGRHNKPTPPNVPQHIHSQLALSVYIEESDIPLESVGADGLPSYTRVGKPGEVRPGYHVTHEVHETVRQSTPAANNERILRLEDEATVESGRVSPPVYQETHTLEIWALPPTDSTNESQAVAPGAATVETVMRERSLLGKMWYGRALVPVPVPNLEIERGGKKSLWKRIRRGS